MDERALIHDWNEAQGAFDWSSVGHVALATR